MNVSKLLFKPGLDVTEYPNCLHIVIDAWVVQPLEHIASHPNGVSTSTLPWFVLDPESTTRRVSVNT